MAKITKTAVREGYVDAIRSHTVITMVHIGQVEEADLRNPANGRYEFDAVGDAAAEACVRELDSLFAGSVGMGRCRFTRRGRTVRVAVFTSKIHW